MRLSFFLAIFTVTAGAARAHVGHLGDLAGHDHWVAAGAIGAAIAVAGWNALKGKKKSDVEDASSEQSEETPQEA